MKYCLGKSITRRQLMILASGWALVISLAGCAANESIEFDKPFSFGVIADVQYADYEHLGNRYYRASESKLSDCVEQLNSKDLCFVIQLGDFIDGGFENFDKMLDIYRRLKAARYHVLGNHDFAARRDKVLKKLGLERGYYDFSVGGWRFVVLDGNRISMYANAKDSREYKKAKAIYQKLKDAKASNAVTWNGSLGEEQTVWLKDVLDRAETSGEKVILFCHFPVYLPNVHNLWNDSELVELFESYDCVVAYISGHNHAGNYAVKNGIGYLTLRGMVETPAETAFAVVEVYPNRLNVIGFGAETSRTLYIRNE